MGKKITKKKIYSSKKAVPQNIRENLEGFQDVPELKKSSEYKAHQKTEESSKLDPTSKSRVLKMKKDYAAKVEKLRGKYPTKKAPEKKKKKKKWYSFLPGMAVGGKADTDTVPAMLTPGEVVLNAGQQKKLGGLVGQPSSKVFQKIGVPGFQDGGIANTPVFKRKVTKENKNLRAMREIIKMAGGGIVPKRSDIYRGIYLAKMRKR